MFVALQTPLADVRPLLDGATGRLERPAWPGADPLTEFVRLTGRIVQRPPYSGRVPLGPNGVFCDVSGAIRMTSDFSRLELGLSREFWGPRLRYRHLRFDAFGKGALELAFEANDSGDVHDGDCVTALATAAAALPVRVRQANGTTWGDEYLKLGTPISRHFLANTMSKKAAVSVQPWWVSSTSPSIFIDATGMRFNSRAGEELKSPVLNSAGIALYHYSIRRRGSSCKVWVLFAQDGGGIGVRRQVRSALQDRRLTRWWVFQILRLVQQGRIPMNGDSGPRLQERLDQAVRGLLSPKRFGIDLSEVEAAAYAADDDISEDQRRQLIEQVQWYSPKLSNELEQSITIAQQEVTLLADGKSSDYLGARVTFIKVEKGGVANVQDNSIRTGNVIGAVGHDITIKDSLNFVQNSAASGELKQVLEQLHELSLKAAADLPQPDQQSLAQRVESFSKEAVSSKPDRTILGAVGDAIKATVSGVATYGPQIVGVVASVLALIPK